MSEYNARVITLEPAVLAAQRAAVEAGSDDGLERPGVLAVRLDGLAAEAATALGREARACGAEAWLSAQADQALPAHDALLLVSRSQFNPLLARLDEAGWPDLAGAIADLVRNLDAPLRPLVCGPHTLPVGERTLLMGIVNMTPDSFSGDSLGDDVEGAVAQARRMQAEGADLLDVGGLSTRPGSAPVPVEEEVRRVAPVVQRLAAEVPLPISVDTYRAAVAEAALAAGAHLVNDITGFREDPAILEVAARRGAAVIAMHIQGRPATMQQHPTYTDLLGEVIAYLRESVRLAVAAGVPQERIWIDPGIGFGKTFDHNLELLHRLGELRSLGQPILVGTSRKAFIGRLLGGKPPAERVIGTGATLAVSIRNGADAVRVHDVGPAADVIRLADAIVRFPFNRENKDK